MDDQVLSNPPDILSREWNDYVMSFFDEKELIDGHPLTTGLRRVSEMLIGEIVSSKPVSVVVNEFPAPIGKVTVVYEVQFLVRRGDNVLIKTYADVADVWEQNTDDLFVVHAAATASTKAEGRALRKALKLRVVAAEELCKKDPSKFLNSSSVVSDDRITKDQLNFIDMKCRKLDINVDRFINSGEKQYRSIYEVKKDVAAKMIKTLSGFASSSGFDANGIKGYEENWNKQ